MGVPKFFAWLTKVCPWIIQTAVPESLLIVGKVKYQIAFVLTRTDNLYLDMNGIVHMCKQVCDNFHKE